MQGFILNKLKFNIIYSYNDPLVNYMLVEKLIYIIKVNINKKENLKNIVQFLSTSNSYDSYLLKNRLEKLKQNIEIEDNIYRFIINNLK